MCSQGSFNFATDNFSSSISFNVPAIIGEAIEKVQCVGQGKKKNVKNLEVSTTFLVLGLIKRSVMTPPYLFHDNQMNAKLIEMMTKNTVAKDVCNSLERR